MTPRRYVLGYAADSVSRARVRRFE